MDCRITPIEPEEFPEPMKEHLGGWTELHFNRVLMRSPQLFKAFSPFLGRAVPNTSLPSIDRQVLILRTCALTGEKYEATHHIEISRAAGITDEEIDAARNGDDRLADEYKPLARAAEQLVDHYRIDDDTWAILKERYTEEQLMDIVTSVGAYVVMTMYTVGLDIPLESEEAVKGFQAIRHYR